MLLTLGQTETAVPLYLTPRDFIDRAQINKEILYALIRSGAIEFYKNSDNLIMIPSYELAKLQDEEELGSILSIFSKAKDMVQKVANTKAGSRIKAGVQKLLPRAVAIIAQKKTNLIPPRISQAPEPITYVPQPQQYSVVNPPTQPGFVTYLPQVQQYPVVNPQIQPQAFMPMPEQSTGGNNTKLYVGLAIGAVALIGVAIVITRRQQPALLTPI